MVAFEGWGATRFEEGEHRQGRWDEKLEVSRKFHRDLGRRRTPPLPPTADRWTRAHGIAWREAPLPGIVHSDSARLIEDLFRSYTPGVRSRKIMHSDLCGNILFHPQLPPCLIDFSPAYGSQEYAASILAADAIAWEEAPLDLLDLLPYNETACQHLLRAVNFRLITTALFKPRDSRYFNNEYAGYRPLIEHIIYAAAGLRPDTAGSLQPV